MTRTSLAKMVVFLVGLSPFIAVAQPAKLHYKTGQAYYQEGAYAKAIEEFTKAYELAKKPALLYNIGQCHERLGAVGKAIGFFQRYLTESRRKDPALEKKIKNLQNRLRQTGLRISCTVKGATVTVDGNEVGKTPLDRVIVVAPGQHKLTVSKEGFTTYSLAVSVVAGAAVTVNAELTPSATKSPEEKPGEKKPEQKQPLDEAGAGGQQQIPPEQPAAGKPRKRLWTWIAYGTAGALLVGGAIFGGLALNRANNATANNENGARGMAIAADVLIGAGVAAAITGTVLLFVEGRPAKTERSSTIQPLVGPTYVGAGGTF